MKLRLDGLGSGWAAFCAGRCVPDLSLKLLDLRCAWPAMGSAAAAKQSGSVAMRRPNEADRPTDLVDEFGMLKAAPTQWCGVFMLASRKGAIFVLPKIGISSLSRSGSG
jgi:hypothetical protein